jgi:hypothetical protein
MSKAVNGQIAGERILFETLTVLLALRISRFPATGQVVVKERVNAIGLPSVEDIRRDSDLFLEGTRTNQFHQLTEAAMKRGFQTRNAEMDLAQLVSKLAE